MALTGQLSDMSLAELIEFFCNQRKTGRLKIDYPRGHSVFFIKDGELVDARVGALSGADAVYFSLTLPNAAFDFSPDVQATRRTIDGAWTQVVLEGLRRLDEGLSPTEADAFGAWSPSETELAQMFDQVEHLDSSEQQKSPRRKAAASRAVKTDDAAVLEDSTREESEAAPFSLMVESASGSGSKKKFMLAGVVAAVVLALVVAAVPLLTRRASKGVDSSAAAASPAAAAPARTSPAASDASTGEASSETASDAAPVEATDPSAAAADAAHREALDRERRERERRRKEDAAAKKEEAASDPEAAKTPAQTSPAGPKSVKVSVSYDEAGRVTQASVAGATPGAEAYGSTAVRIARGKRFATGKAGTTVITIPVN
jgi:hypothetical protein